MDEFSIECSSHTNRHGVTWWTININKNIISHDVVLQDISCIVPMTKSRAIYRSKSNKLTGWATSIFGAVGQDAMQRRSPVVVSINVKMGNRGS